MAEAVLGGELAALPAAGLGGLVARRLDGLAVAPDAEFRLRTGLVVVAVRACCGGARPDQNEKSFQTSLRRNFWPRGNARPRNAAGHGEVAAVSGARGSRGNARVRRAPHVRRGAAQRAEARDCRACGSCDRVAGGGGDRGVAVIFLAARGELGGGLRNLRRDDADRVVVLLGTLKDVVHPVNGFAGDGPMLRTKSSRSEERF